MTPKLCNDMYLKGFNFPVYYIWSSICAGKWETQILALLEYSIEILSKPHYRESYTVLFSHY